MLATTSTPGASSSASTLTNPGIGVIPEPRLRRSPVTCAVSLVAPEEVGDQMISVWHRHPVRGVVGVQPVPDLLVMIGLRSAIALPKPLQRPRGILELITVKLGVEVVPVAPTGVDARARTEVEPVGDPARVEEAQPRPEIPEFPALLHESPGRGPGELRDHLGRADREDVVIDEAEVVGAPGPDVVRERPVQGPSVRARGIRAGPSRSGKAKVGNLLLDADGPDLGAAAGVGGVIRDRVVEGVPE